MVKRKDALRALLSGSGRLDEGEGPGKAEETGAAAPSGSSASTGETSGTRRPSDVGATGETGATGEMDAIGEGAGEPASSPAPARKPVADHMRSGAINAMRESWGELRREAEAARTMREEIAGGGHVVLVDPALILPSPITDRLSREGEANEDFESLKASIAEGGQAVPVLLRPHSDAEKAGAGFYETAYGHRRVRAARELGLKVRAIIRALTDEELILAQGRENAERRDLSFIERALFAQTLEGRGFARETIRTALAIDNTQLTRLLQVATRVPEPVLRRIGAAPKAGRPRWGELGEMVSVRGGAEIAHEFTLRESFGAIGDSDARFRALFRRMQDWTERRGKAKPASRRTITEGTGEAIASVGEARGGRPQLTLVGPEASAFGAYLAQRLPALLDEFRASSDTERAQETVKPDGEGAD
ncbi:plasmid partitioning protein RepB [Fulvimarina endophytica]|uniref:Plasmid partitioning protein RepB n=1 Tax=Fulvimarina endophytica TaxID=2293836 RepID=A0A371WYB4_9HYPH|nr:plasmid partitioning protein RepB [Fulvimarina endophytica]RFC61987.1 plasmid partitioning protein RepB [Fulvimarina endophytica]